MITLDLTVTLVSIAAIVLLYTARRRRNTLPLPPGPRKWPLVGNLFDVPASLEWETYHRWCKEFDTDIIHLNVAGTSVIVLDTAEASMELLERRSSIYSSRCRFPMLNELCGYDFHFAFMEYGNYWRENRRLFHQYFHPAAAKLLHPKLTKATHGVLRRILAEPNVPIYQHLRHMAGETIMSIAYGLDVLPQNDPYVKAAEGGAVPISVAGVPGAFLVDTIPVLKYVPDWIPFAGFKHKAKEWKKMGSGMVDVPFDAAMRKIERGEITRSFVADNLAQMDESRDLKHQETVIKSVAGSMYAAGSDTTISSISSCVLAILAYPEVLKKAQQEMDTVLGSGRLPDLDDETSLPYVTAVVKEALRWREVTPIGVPHLLDVEDEYKGYRIPAGSIIVPNAWAMLHNETTYPDPFTFNPDRFLKDGKLDPKVKDPVHAAFGFGRRICPGRYMAISAVWIAIASIIACFDITKDVDEEGKDIEPTYEYHTGLVCHPVPFKCSIKPRSKQHEGLILATANNFYE